MKVLPNDLVYLLVGMGDPTRHLRLREAMAAKREEHRCFIAKLNLEGGKVDTLPLKPGWRTGLQAAHLKTNAQDRLSEWHRSLFP